MDGDNLSPCPNVPAAASANAPSVCSRRAAGDSLGLRDDPESRLLLAEVVAERYAESLDPSLLHDWEKMVMELEHSDSGTWSPELKRQLRMHRVMLDK